MTLTLFYAPGACALASHIALEDAGADYKLHRVDFKSGEQNSAAFHRINPKGRVPALATEKGVLTESPVILGYIAQTHPGAKLAPNDSSFDFGMMQSFNMWIASTLHPAFAHVFRVGRYVDGEEHQAAVKAKAPQAIAQLFQTAEDSLFEGPWVTGENYTVADPYLFTMTNWLTRNEAFPEIDRYPKIADHFARMSQRLAVQRALAAEAA